MTERSSYRPEEQQYWWLRLALRNGPQLSTASAGVWSPSGSPQVWHPAYAG
ncbi:hypothetical protein [Streptomyces goshikiensis]|uniref:hypothetical protein n=1 Tax=Streptomyces goshikiensis TaxID=1942 RepID=UPI0037126769